MSGAKRFGTVKAAKDYLVGRVGEEAERQGNSLSKIEREMLYFTEDGPLSKHMEDVCEEFDREYSDEGYEFRIAEIVRSLLARLTPEEKGIWDDAVLKLCEGDHYLLVLIDKGAPPSGTLISVPSRLRAWLPDVEHETRRPSGDLRRLILVAAILSLVIFGAMIFFGSR